MKMRCFEEAKIHGESTYIYYTQQYKSLSHPSSGTINVSASLNHSNSAIQPFPTCEPFKLKSELWNRDQSISLCHVWIFYKILLHENWLFKLLHFKIICYTTTVSSISYINLVTIIPHQKRLFKIGTHHQISLNTIFIAILFIITKDWK